MCDDDKLGSLEVYMVCEMTIRLEVYKSTNLRIVFDDDRFGSLEVYKFTLCVRR